MTTYTAIPNGDVDPDSPITTGLMTKLRDNPVAITEGSAGAPNIQTAAIANDAITAAKIPANEIDTSEIAAAAIGQSQIANNTTTQAGSLGSNSYKYFSLNNWALFPSVYSDDADVKMVVHDTDGAPGSPRFGIKNEAGSTTNWDVDHRAIIAA